MRPCRPINDIGRDDSFKPCKMIEQENMSLFQELIIGVNPEIQPKSASEGLICPDAPVIGVITDREQVSVDIGHFGTSQCPKGNKYKA